MNEVKEPNKKPLLYYYFLALLLIFLFNFLVFPQMVAPRVREIDYGTFMTMTEDHKVDQVQLESNQIVFSDKDGNLYKTGLMDDPNLVERLHDANVTFASQIVQQLSPFANFLLSWVLPIAIFYFLGRMLNRRMMKNFGGDGMMFNMGKSNAKVYVPSETGIKFADVAGEEEAKENLQEIVNYLHDPSKYQKIGAKMPKGVAIVHGPPGTGKTTTLVEAIYETLMRESQVLVCAQSNMAVDWISEKLVDRGVNVLRIGNPTRVNDKMLSFTYERRFEAHPDYEMLWALRKAIREVRANRKRGDQKFHQKVERLKERATELELRIKNDLFSEARVIACTLVGSANKVLDGQKFGTLFIDEAAQALEAACWIPMRRVSRVILAGDHCQLPPTVKCYEALKAGLGKTLMERIVENKPEVVTLLKMQYRMNEEIMRFSSDWFYNNQVESAPDVKYRSILDLDVPMTWIDTSQFDFPEESGITFKEEFVGESFGRINKAEAELTILALQQYFEKIGKERIIKERIDVGVISPYRAQVQYLRQQLKKREFFKPFKSLISINTVDGFQGQERDIIMISLVRANDEGQIGFLRDLRRMNVAITRARMKLIILGDASTLTRHPFYKKLYDYIEAL